MKLYHFTAKHLIDSILKEGLTKGGIPLIENDQINFITPVQWLTANKTYNQIWCEQKVLLQYDRNEVRLTIKIPTGDLNKNLFKWDEFIKQKGFEKLSYLNDKDGDFHNWYVYGGRIKRHWIRNIDYKIT